MSPSEFYATSRQDLFDFLHGRRQNEQREYERMRFLASCWVDTSKVVFPWESPKKTGRKSKPIDKQKLEQMKKNDLERMRKHGLYTG